MTNNDLIKHLLEHKDAIVQVAGERLKMAIDQLTKPQLYSREDNVANKPFKTPQKRRK